MTLLTLTFVALAAFTSPGSDEATDWPQFRGPLRTGEAAVQPVSEAWVRGGPNELWRRPLGSGFSTITSVGDRLYTMASTAEHEVVVCLDATSGETIWQAPLGDRFVDQFGDGPRATPTVDGDTLFAVSSTMQLAALAVDSGEERWRINLLEEFGIQQPRFGFSPSVIVVNNRVILEIGAAEGKSVVALERNTGELAWSALEGPAGSSSPLLVEIGGVPQLIFSRRPDLVALSLEGEVLWTHEAAADVIVMAQFIAPNFVFTSSAQMGKGGMLVEVTENGGTFAAEAVWVNRRFRNHFNNSVVVDGHLYGFDNSTLRCLSVETGDICWSERGLGKGSLIACGELLFVLGDQGTLVLLAASPEGYQERGQIEALEGRCWTSPTLASGRLLVRNLEEIVAYDARPVGPSSIGVMTDAEPSLSTPVAAESVLMDVPAIVQGYQTARGGLERWREVQTLELSGIFSAFSESSPFTLQRRREDLYRFEYGMVGSRDARGRDSEDLWWQYHLFEITDPARVAMEPYHAQMRRESMFEPALFDVEAKGIKVEALGAGEVNGQVTLNVKLTFPDGAVETWMLDPRTFLEVAVDSVIIDMTQAREPMDRRTFYSGFKTVEGLVLPFKLAMEFGARLEEVEVTGARVNPDLSVEAFAMPVTEAKDSGAVDGEDGDDGEAGGR